MKQGEVRIIGGKWRGRKLKVLDIKDLRPTPDRVRETLFNWLSPYLPHAYCLDLFAGSGALGFEALSRGAAFVVMIDNESKTVDLLKEEQLKFDAKNTLIYQAKAPRGLEPVLHPFNIVFLDPPYQENLLLQSCEYLEAQGFLAQKCFIYLEAEEQIQDNVLPPNWRIIKSKKAGQVFYHLAYREKK